MNHTIAGRVYRACLAGILAGCCAIEAGAAPANAPVLTLDEAVQRTLDHHPALGAARLDVDVERARRDSESQSPPLSLDTEVENFGGTGVASGIDNAELTLQLSRVLERGEKAVMRHEIGERRVEAALTARQSASLQLAHEATSRFIEVVLLQERAALAQQSEALANRTLEFVQARVLAGRSTQAEASFVNVEVARTELSREQVERELDTARMALGSLWQAPAPDFGRAEADIFALPVPPSFESLETRLGDSPALVQQAAERRLIEAQSRLAAARQSGDVSVAGGVRHLGETDDLGLVFSFSVPFGSAGRARTRMEESGFLLEQNAFSTEARMLDLRATLYGLCNDLRSTELSVRRLADDILPEAETAVRLYEEAFRIGRSTLIELTQAQKELLLLQNELVDSAGRYHQLMLDVEYLLGGQYEVQP